MKEGFVKLIDKEIISLGLQQVLRWILVPIPTFERVRGFYFWCNLIIVAHRKCTRAGLHTWDF